MNSIFNDPGFWHRLQFGFTITYHYLFPQLTMGLAWFLVYWKWRALRTGDEKYNQAVRFWAKIFGLNFAVGVVTGIPMEFQFGTNWADFSKYAGGVIGQTLAMEGMFAFFLESAFVGWMTAELGRQPWLIYGLFHTRDGYSKVVSNGDAIFTLIGFTGLYFVIGLLFLGLTGREIGKGPKEPAGAAIIPEREAVLV